MSNTAFGSFQNTVLSNVHGAPEPAVGMGATRLSWSDRAAHTVIEVSADGLVMVVQEDVSTRTDSWGMSDCQQYAFRSDPEGRRAVCRKSRKDGKWRECAPVAEGKKPLAPKASGAEFVVGYRSTYHDFSF